MYKKTKIKKSFIERLNEIKNIKAIDVPKKVVLVNKPFHDDLVSWLTIKKAKKPKNLNTEFLIEDDKIKSNIKRGVDYEIIGSNLWNDIIKKFGTVPKVEAILVKNPKNGDDTVLILNDNCIQFNIYLPKKKKTTNSYSISKMPIEYYSHSDWLLEDVKSKICEIYSIDKNTFSFTRHKAPNLNHIIDEKTKMIQVSNTYKNDLDLRQNKQDQTQGKKSKKEVKPPKPSIFAAELLNDQKNGMTKSLENHPNNKIIAKPAASNSKRKPPPKNVIVCIYASSSDPSSSESSYSCNDSKYNLRD